MDHRLLAVAVSAVAVTSSVIATILRISNQGASPEGLGTTLSIIPFAVVGALVAWRRPGNSVGWMFVAIGFLAGTGLLAEEYALYAYVTRGISLPWAVGAAWHAEWYWVPFLFLSFVFTLLVFPTGRLPSRRWRPLLWLATVASGALTILAALDPQLELRESGVSVANPIGVAWLRDVEEPPMVFVLFPILVISAVGAVASLVARFRRATGEERQQLKWFTYAGVVLIAGFVVFGVLDAATGDRLPLIEPVLLSLPPVAAGAAILRYRLYDIDLVINRTLVYVTITALLGLVYVAGVMGLPRLLPMQGDNDLFVAGSTLAVAALFSPARRRIQGVVDRRFYRSRYDAVRTVEAFATRLRDQVDLDTLSSDLQAVVRDTLQPVSMSVWLREPEGVGR